MILHFKSLSYQSEKYSSFWVNKYFNSLHKNLNVTERTGWNTQHYLSPKSSASYCPMSAFPKTVYASPSDSAIAQPRPRISPSWRRSLEAKHSQGIKCVTLQSSDLKSQLTSVMEAYSTEQEILTRNTRVPEKAAAALNNSACHIHDLPSSHWVPSGFNSLRMLFILCPRFGETLTTRPPSHLDAHRHSFAKLETYKMLTLHEYICFKLIINTLNEKCIIWNYSL